VRRPREGQLAALAHDRLAYGRDVRDAILLQIVGECRVVARRWLIGNDANLRVQCRKHDGDAADVRADVEDDVTG
jgi:hypothetical protein